MQSSLRPVRILTTSLTIASIAALASVASAIDETRRKAADQRAAEVKPSRVNPSAANPPARLRDEGRIAPQLVPRQRWSLGVRVDNLETGVRITHVSPATAAWQSGLESRDRIVSVNGFQVGYVTRRLYDLGRELNLQADARGWVRLLVWNHRNGELVNIDVALDRQGGPTRPPRVRGIEGEVTFATSVTAAQNASVAVQLLDITDRLKTPKRIAIQEIPYRGQTPVRFFLEVDVDSLSPNRRYELKASLNVNGRPVMASLPGSYMLNRRTSNSVQMKLKPVRFDQRRRP